MSWLDKAWKWLKRAAVVVVAVLAYILWKRWQSPTPAEYREAGERKTRSVSEAQREAEEREEAEGRAADARERAEERVRSIKESDHDEVDDVAEYYRSRRRVRGD